MLKNVLILSLIMLGHDHVEARSPVVSLLEQRQKNVVMQEWDLSCGAAALTTLFRYQHGVDITEKEVATELIDRQEYKDNPDLLKLKQGFSLLDLKNYADNHGFEGNGYGQLTLDNLIEMAPVLVPVNFEGYNHFVIFRGVSANRVLLADPAWGNRTVLLDKFMEVWINFKDLGHIGFTVTGENHRSMNQLLPTDLDFVMIR